MLTREEVKKLEDKMRGFPEDPTKNDRKSARRFEEIRLRDRELTKNIKNGVSILTKKLEDFDCAILTSYRSNFDDDIIGRRFTRLQYQALNKDYQVFLVKANSKNPKLESAEIKDSVLVLIDSKNLKTLEKDTEIWANTYNQKKAYFIPKIGRAKELYSKTEFSSFKKLKTSRKCISKILEKRFSFKESLIMEFSKPDTIMGKRFISELLK